MTTREKPAFACVSHSTAKSNKKAAISNGNESRKLPFAFRTAALTPQRVWCPPLRHDDDLVGSLRATQGRVCDRDHFSSPDLRFA